MTVPWPRHWYNFPIILCGICVQLAWALSLLIDRTTVNATVIHAMLPYFHTHTNLLGSHPLYFSVTLAVLMILISAMSIVGFYLRRKIHTILAFMPQQFALLISSGGVIHAILLGQTANGDFFPRAFIFATQSPILFLTVFHTWAMILILINASDS